VLRLQPVHQQVLALLGPAYEECYKSTNWPCGKWGEDAGEGAGVPEDQEFALNILPKLAAVRLVDLMQATGLSRRYCWLIKTGQKVPHPRHLAAFRKVTADHW